MQSTGIRGLLMYGNFLANLVARDLKVRYRRSMLGFVWTMLHPLLLTAVFTIVFSTIFRFELKNFVIYFLSGYLLWMFFSQSTIASSRCIVANGNLLRTIYFPRGMLALSIVVSGLVNLCFALAPLLALAVFTGLGLSVSVLFLPIAMILTLMFTLGISLGLAAVSVFFQDVAEMYQTLTLPWLYLTPIVYPLDIVPDRFVALIKLNPMYHLVECFRAPIYSGTLPALDHIVIAAAASILTLTIGCVVFLKLEDSFVYHV